MHLVLGVLKFLCCMHVVQKGPVINVFGSHLKKIVLKSAEPVMILDLHLICFRIV